LRRTIIAIAIALALVGCGLSAVELATLAASGAAAVVTGYEMLPTATPADTAKPAQAPSPGVL